MQPTLRFGLVGAGAIAQAYAQVFRTLAHCELVGIADCRMGAARAMAEPFGCGVFDSHLTLFEGGELDAVVVCTPPATHEQICLDLLQRGISVLCEKPLCTSIGGARRLLAAGRDNGVTLTMAAKFRYVDDVVRAKQMVDEGRLGDILLFENAFTARVDMSRRWNCNPELSGGGVLIDNGTHSVDLARYFLGPLAEVQAVEGKRVQSPEVEDTARIFVRSHSGIHGTLDLSWSIDKARDTFIEIYGTEGTVRVGWKESSFRPAAGKPWETFGSGYDKLDAFRKQVVNFANAVRGCEPLRITGDDALASVAVMQAAYRSLRHATWIEVAGLGG